jgi:DNA adenine methylase
MTRIQRTNGKRNGKPPGLTTLTRKKLILFGWYGGKFSHLDWLLPLLPQCHHYCEPFAGSAAVLLNRNPAPIETYNDLDGEVTNFFRMLRASGEELQRLLGLTPFSREEFALACRLDPDATPLERARRFYIRARQVRTGLDQLAEISARLLRVQIENRPAADVIRLYDSPKTLFYCDPPYVHETRGDSKAYRHEMTDEQHAELADVLNSVKGKVAFSNYDCKLLDKLYPPSKWSKTLTKPKTNHATKGERVEVLWTNYRVDKLPTSSPTLFH